MGKTFRNRWVKIGMMFVFAIGMTVLAACGGGSGSSPSSTPPSTPSTPSTPSGSQESGAKAGTLGSNFDEIVKLAAEEGKMVWWGSTPEEDQMEELVAAFNQRFGLNVAIERVAMSAGDVPARLIAEKTGGKFTVSASAGSQPTLLPLMKENIIEKIDYVGLFDGHIKGVKVSADNVIAENRGFGLEWRHLVYGIVYNTKSLTPDQAPKTWDELLDPKWKGKITIDAELSPISRLAGVISEEELVAYTKKLLDNKPIFGKGSSNVVNKVVTGEAPVAVLSLNSAIADKNKGAPIEIIFPTPLAQVNAQAAYVPKNAPAPNLGALWVAWLTTEGFEITAKDGIAKARPGEPGPFAEYLEKNNLKPMEETLASIEEQVVIKKRLAQLTTGN